MCGISGIIRFKGSRLNKRDFSILKNIGDRLKNRGPDDEATFADNDVTFLFRRLSIIDLEGGRQPFQDARAVGMVNGEIYNYKSLKKKISYNFKSDSDGEVILPLWDERGESFLESLNGMFALAIYDKKKKQVLLARDRMGIKPLYYAITKKGHLIFASEIKGLLAHPDCPRELDWEAHLTRRMKVQDLSQPLMSGFKGIEMLPAASYLLIDLKKESLTQKKWWTLDFKQKNDLTEKEAIQKYHDLLADSIELQLMSDVEVGLALSGGIDSVAIAAFAAKHKPIKTFTVLSQSTYLTGDCESAFYAAKHLGLENHQLYFPWQKEILTADLFKEINWACEMPTNPEQVFKFLLYRKIRQDFPQVKTILLGQGSDEFNGGYCHVYLQEQYPELKEESHDWPLFINTMAKMKREARLNQKDPYLIVDAPFLNDEFVSKFASFPDISPWNYYQSFYARSIEDYNLWHEDRTASANQLENRVPFLDHRLVEFCAKVPLKLHEKLFWEKKILRKAVKDLLPKKHVDREKIPFYMGSAEKYALRMMYDLLASNKQALLKEALLENPHVSSILDIEAIRSHFKAMPDNPSFSGTEFLIELTSLGLWSKWLKEKPPESVEVDIDWMPIKDWKKEKKAIDTQMSESKLCLKKNTVLRFAKDVFLVHKPKDDQYYLSRDFTLEHEICNKTKKPYINFLKEIDGKKSLSSLLKKVQIPLETLIPDIEEALEYAILEIVKK